MNLKALKKLEIKDYEVAKNFDCVKEYLDQFTSNKFLTGNTIDTTILTTATQISHGLGQEPYGFLILDQTANAVIWRVSWTDKFITLQASASCPVKLWVF